MSREEEEKEIEATKAPLMEHLIELRGRLIKAIAAFVVAAPGCRRSARGRGANRACAAARSDR